MINRKEAKVFLKHKHYTETVFQVISLKDDQ